MSFCWCFSGGLLHATLRNEQFLTSLNGGVFILTTLFLLVNIIKKYVKGETLTGHTSRIIADIDYWDAVNSTIFGIVCIEP